MAANSNSTLSELLEILLIFCGKLSWKLSQQQLQPSGKQLLCVKVAEFSRRRCRWWWRTSCLSAYLWLSGTGGGGGSHTAPCRAPKRLGTKESVRVCWTLFWRQKQTLRPSCFSGGYETEEPAAPPTPPPSPPPYSLLRHNRLTAAQRASEMWRPSARTHRGPRDTNWRVKPCDFLLSFSCVCGLKGAANERRHCGRAANAFSLFVSPRRRAPPAGEDIGCVPPTGFLSPSLRKCSEALFIFIYFFILLN